MRKTNSGTAKNPETKIAAKPCRTTQSAVKPEPPQHGWRQQEQLRNSIRDPSRQRTPPRPKQAKKKNTNIRAIMTSSERQGGLGSVRLRFGLGRVRAVPGFLFGRLTSRDSEKGTVPVPRFCFPVPGKNSSSGSSFRFWFGSWETLKRSAFQEHDVREDKGKIQNQNTERTTGIARKNQDPNQKSWSDQQRE